MKKPLAFVTKHLTFLLLVAAATPEPGALYLLPVLLLFSNIGEMVQSYEIKLKIDN